MTNKLLEVGKAYVEREKATPPESSVVRKLACLAWRVLGRVGPLGYLCFKYWVERYLPDRDTVIFWDGQQIVVRSPRHSVIGREMFLRGVWEPEVTSFICRRLQPGMTVLDVGADVGYYTLLFAKRVGTRGKVISFEPIPSARERLDYNVRLNGYSNVIVSSFALFNRHGTATLEDPFGVSRMSTDKSAHGKNDIEIKMVVFDEYAPELDIERIDLVKIDVEGAEMDVLLGMRESLEKYHPDLLVEVHPADIIEFQHTADDLIAFLGAMEYLIRPLDKPSVDFTRGNITIYCAYHRA